MYKCINRLLPSKFCDVFEFKYEIYNYGSGFTTDLHFPKHRTFAFQHNIRFSGTQLWNYLPDDILKSQSSNNFLLKLKQYFLFRYCTLVIEESHWIFVDWIFTRVLSIDLLICQSTHSSWEIVCPSIYSFFRILSVCVRAFPLYACHLGFSLLQLFKCLLYSCCFSWRK